MPLNNLLNYYYASDMLSIMNAILVYLKVDSFEEIGNLPILFDHNKAGAVSLYCLCQYCRKYPSKITEYNKAILTGIGSLNENDFSGYWKEYERITGEKV